MKGAAMTLLTDFCDGRTKVLRTSDWDTATEGGRCSPTRPALFKRPEEDVHREERRWRKRREKGKVLSFPQRLDGVLNIVTLRMYI